MAFVELKSIDLLEAPRFCRDDAASDSSGTGGHWVFEMYPSEKITEINATRRFSYEGMVYFVRRTQFRPVGDAMKVSYECLQARKLGDL